MRRIVAVLALIAGILVTDRPVQARALADMQTRVDTVYLYCLQYYPWGEHCLVEIRYQFLQWPPDHWRTIYAETLWIGDAPFPPPPLPPPPPPPNTCPGTEIICPDPY